MTTRKPSMRRQSFVERYILGRVGAGFDGSESNSLREANEVFDAIEADACKRRDSVVARHVGTGAESYRKEYWSKPIFPHTADELAAKIDVILDRTDMYMGKERNTPENSGLRPALVLAKALV